MFSFGPVRFRNTCTSSNKSSKRSKRPDSESRAENVTFAAHKSLISATSVLTEFAWTPNEFRLLQTCPRQRSDKPSKRSSDSSATTDALYPTFPKLSQLYERLSKTRSFLCLNRLSAPSTLSNGLSPPTRSSLTQILQRLSLSTLTLLMSDSAPSSLRAVLIVFNA